MGLLLTGVIVTVEVTTVLVAGELSSSVTCQLIVRLAVGVVGSLLLEL